jgi:CHAT domain-containing protein
LIPLEALFQERILKMRSRVLSVAGIVLLGAGRLVFPNADVCGIENRSAFIQPWQTQLEVLTPGSALERELKGGEAQEFVVRIQPGQFLHVDVEQIGIDVEVTLIAPDGQKLITVDSPNDQYGPEQLVWEAATAGEHKLQVRSGNSKALSGRYQISLVASRPPTTTDKALIKAARAFAEGQRLRSQRTAPMRAAAIKKFEEALRGFQSLGKDYWSGLSLHALGSTYVQSSEFAPALRAFDQALPLFRDIGDKRREAGVHNFIGGIHDVLGNQAEALTDYQRALALLEQVADPSQKASVLNNIGKVQSDLSEWQVSLDYYNQAVPILHVSGNPRREAIAIYNVGLLYYRLGDFERSLAHAGQALQLFRQAEDKDGQATTLGLIGLVYVTQGDIQKGLDFYSQSLLLRREVGDPRGEANTLDYLGVAYSKLNELPKALEYHEQALRLLRKAGDRRSEALTLTNLGHVHYLLKNSARALENFKEALAIFREIEDRNSVARTLVGIAGVESDRGDFVAARRSLEEALTLIEQVRSATGTQQLRASYLASKQEAYKLYVDLLMRQQFLKPDVGYDAEALAASQRARARSLLELLNEAHVNIRKGVSPELIQQEEELAQLLNAKARRQIQLLAQKNVQAQLKEVNEEIRALEEKFEQVQSAIRNASPTYAALTQPQPLSVREIQEQLDPNTLLLEYSLGEPRSYLWVVSNSKLHSYELPRQEQLQMRAREVYELLTTRSVSLKAETASARQSRIAQADSKLLIASSELSQLLLGPVAEEIEGKRLVIVADGALQYVPFAALPSPRKGAEATKAYQPLILDHEIISLPSASALAVQRKNLSGRRPAANAVAVIADPVFSTADERFKSGSRHNAPMDGGAYKDSNDAMSSRILEHLAADGGDLRIRRLPFTRQEAEQILAVAPRQGNLKATDFKANRKVATGAELSKYRYVHFATHGYLDSDRPDLSAIVLSLVDQKGQSQDGFLRAHEIYNLNLPAELVVLSACQTGLGKEIKGEGLVGLTRGFMYAGARRVVVSLWNVNDRATADLMQRFYRGMLREGQTPSAALRKAQAEMWQQKQWQSPYYWAPFVLQGEWN